MNYFELYSLPVSFNVDEKVVKRKFYELSKKYHPDFYVNEPEEKQQEILELSTLNNRAFQVLSDPQKRMEYVLQINGLLLEGEKYQLPQAFLMEMMEVNEAVLELEFDQGDVAVQGVSDNIASIEQSLQQELAVFFRDFETLEETQRLECLKEIKDIYYRQKYLLRIKDSLDRFASRN